MIDVHCKIGKVKFKNGTELQVLTKPESNIASDGLHEFASTTRRHNPLAYGAFVVYEDGTTDTFVGANNGSSKVHTIGGASLLLNRFEELENDWVK